MNNRFCFVAIVKNESPVIRRCIDSISNIATSYLICDTGSTDGTPEIIESYMKEKGISGEVIHHPWKNYSDARSYLYDQAYTYKKAQDAEYLIWHDADEVLLTDTKNLNSQSTQKNIDILSYPTKEDADKFYNWLINQPISICYLMTVYGNMRYKRANINKNNQLYVWKSPKHEYIEGTKDNRSIIYDNIIVYPRAEGNAAKDPDRQKKDVNLFIDYINENGGPEKCPREVFYLAQEYQNFNKEKAIEYYKLRITLDGGYIDEKYISYLRLGRLSDGTDKISFWKAGFKENPKRLECVYDLMNYYRSKNDYQKAFNWALKAPENHDVNDDNLFIEQNIYQSFFDLDFAVVAFYLGKYQFANDINQRNLFKNKDPAVKQVIISNQKFIDEKLILNGLTKLVPEEIGLVNQFATLKISSNATTIKTILPQPIQKLDNENIINI